MCHNEESFQVGDANMKNVFTITEPETFLEFQHQIQQEDMDKLIQEKDQKITNLIENFQNVTCENINLKSKIESIEKNQMNFGDTNWISNYRSQISKMIFDEDSNFISTRLEDITAIPLNISPSSFSISPQTLDYMFEPKCIDLTRQNDVGHRLELSNPLLSMMNASSPLNLLNVNESHKHYQNFEILESTSLSSMNLELDKSESTNLSKCDSYAKLKQSEILKFNLESLMERDVRKKFRDKRDIGIRRIDSLLEMRRRNIGDTMEVIIKL